MEIPTDTYEVRSERLLSSILTESLSSYIFVITWLVTLVSLEICSSISSSRFLLLP